MKKTAVLFVFLFALAANAQEKRAIGNYTKLKVRGHFDVTLVSGGGDMIITAKDTDILAHLKTEVAAGTLEIYLDKDYRNRGNNDVNIELPFSSLDEITLNGSGSIVSQTTVKSAGLNTILIGSGDIELFVDAKNARGEVTGSGDLKLKGKTENFEGVVNGSGDLKAFGLSAVNTDVTISGSGDAEVFASENFKARVVGSGDIKYRGNPKHEDMKVSGSGDIDKS